ncbi:hypothetical protein [Legionella worsleiensis]|uniref:Uncharacterized protein n=1 Tax=Legionella worsleiensis TaxID=45076 RepID=A0A0W1AKP7_9GAMM|nr:hypothetical protein [Legionella worsleiensis]KTD81931.1 hypothetical protein Lwor_0234 [Legionella worsleiensis]STY31276.1 Uncharacterised protein [Legionella worsleiensis]
MIILKATDAYIQDFRHLLAQAKLAIEASDAKDVPSGAFFEVYLYDLLEKLSVNTVFSNTFEITSKFAFPDIISKIEQNKWIGIEVKTSQKDWKCFGNSIFENTRIKEVENIFIFFLKSKPNLSCRWDYYAHCIESINITHSPRYQINMNLLEEGKENIFTLFNVTYDEFRALSVEDRMDYVRKLKKKEVGANMALWWLPSNENDEADDSKLAIKLLSELPKSKKNNIISRAIICFPELFLKKSPHKYHRVAKWLAAEFGVVSHSLRDEFSAGGQIKVQIAKNQFLIPRIYELLITLRDEILFLFKTMNTDLLSEYWPDLYVEDTPIQRWIKLVSHYAATSRLSNEHFPVALWLTQLFIQQKED